MYLADFTAIPEACRESGGGFTAFRRADHVLDLRGSADVAEQLLYDHSDKGTFFRSTERSICRGKLEPRSAASRRHRRDAFGPFGPRNHLRVRGEP
jgi:hypothetical protein